MAGRVLILGFDALDFRYLDKFADDLPNFSALRSTGVESPLRSTMPPWTGSAWPSMYTGVDPSYHGVFDFFAHGDDYPNRAPVVSRNDVKAPAIWNYTTDRNLRSIVLNVPVTHPADELNGILLPGYLTSEDTAGYPTDIRTRLQEKYDLDYRVYAEHELSDDPEKKLESYIDLIHSRAEISTQLLEDEAWDIGIMQLQKTDTVFHNFDDEEAFRRVYVAADEFLGDVLEVVDEDDTVIICSDHGMGRTDGYTIYVNEILREAGYVKLSKEDSSPTLGAEKSELANPREEAKPSTSAAAISTLATTFERIGLSPGRVYKLLQKVGLGNVILSRLPEESKQALETGVDWEQSMAYCRSGSELGIRLNVEGREPNGMILQSEYEKIREELIELLSAVKTPDNAFAFETVERKEEYYDGPFTEMACDILMIPSNMNHAISTKLFGEQFIPVDQHDHKQEGVFIGRGPVFNSAWEGEISLTDIAPLVLATAGLPIPDRMTGTIPEHLLQTDVSSEEYGQINYGSSKRTETDSQVEDRLSDLGYI